MSHTRTQRHTKLAQYVIQPKNTVRSRHFAPRMRVSKGIKDSKASFARRAQNGQPRSSFSRSPLSSSLSILLLLAILSLLSPPPPVYPRLAPARCLCIYTSLSSVPLPREGIERALKTRRFEAGALRVHAPTHQKN